MAGQSRIVDRLDLWLPAEKLRDAARIFGMSAHAVRKSLQAAQGEPAFEGRRNSAAFALHAARFFQERVRGFEDQGPGGYVAVSGEVLGNRVHGYVRAQFQRT